MVKNIDRSRPWAYFHGASQRNPPRRGARVVIHLSNDHILKFKARCKSGYTSFK
jgi:hypothetical protein